jgi:uncharacterized membrane protein (TIGR02234 family)
MRRLRPTSKATVLLLALVGALIVLVSGSRTWVSGTVNDAVLGASQIVGTGTQVASGVTALALVAAASALAAATSGRVVRRVALLVLGLTGLGLGLLVAKVVIDPSGVMGAVAARALGRTGTVHTQVSATGWPWLCLVAAALLLFAAGGGWVGASSWRGLGARYEAQGATAAGPRGQRVGSDWDRLDAGDDPTVAQTPNRDQATAVDRDPT